ncbi:hypothetical protein, partial [Caldilinea sp.]|uniref:hypothetical protein n=1 Tax=Caldilinea sp. TaxID=2293560 RepID=UPI001B21D719
IDSCIIGSCTIDSYTIGININICRCSAFDRHSCNAISYPPPLTCSSPANITGRGDTPAS